MFERPRRNVSLPFSPLEKGIEYVAMETLEYGGGELELFAEARRWKAYFSRRLRPFLGSRILEVGAGIGSTTAVLAPGNRREWICLEPDPGLLSRISEKLFRGELPSFCRALEGTISAVDATLEFDAVLYIDVLEHISDDRAELARAAARLAVGGRLIVLAPASPRLFSPFDSAVGHYRRYTRKTLERLTPGRLRIVRSEYLDAAGYLVSLANARGLKSPVPTRGQIRFWDGFVVPFSRIFDPLTGRRFGRSILCIWERAA